MDLEKLICKRTAEMKPSGIRRFFDIANEMEGVVSLGVGEPDFKTPYAIRRAAIDNLQRGNTRYTANSGLMELRKAISDYMRERFTLEYDPTHEIMVTVGGSEGIDLAVRAFIEEGDEVLIPEPSYVAYAPIVSLTFGVPVPIPLKEENNFRLTAEELEAAITPKTKMLMLPFPNNPTGSIMRREHLEAIAEVLRRHDNIVVVSDEIYAELTYNGRHVSIAELPDMWERTIIIGGFSKAFSMTGWRLGYLCAPPAALSQMLKIHQYALMCSPTTSQWGGVEALRNCIDSITAMRDEYNLRRRFVVDERDNIRSVKPLVANTADDVAIGINGFTFFVETGNNFTIGTYDIPLDINFAYLVFLRIINIHAGDSADNIAIRINNRAIGKYLANNVAF